MALSVVKYRKTTTGDTTSAPTILIKNRVQQHQQLHTQHQQIVKATNPILKLEGNAGLIINKIPATIKPAMKRTPTAVPPIEPALKTSKYSLQTIASAGTPQTSFQWQQTTIGGSEGTTITPTTIRRQASSQSAGGLSTVLNSLPSNTIIRTTTTNNNNNNSNNVKNASTIVGGGRAGAFLQTNGVIGSAAAAASVLTPATSNRLSALTSQGTTVQVRRPTILIKSETPKRTIRSVTVDLIEANPFVHLGVSANRLPLLKKIICARANVPLIDCYITLKKLRQNEQFTLLAEYFEMTEAQVQELFARSVVRLAAYLRHLIRWPDSKTYYERHKSLPFAFRSTLAHVQSLIECVETDMLRPVDSDCSQYKFILSITPNGIISYVSEVFLGHHDDLAIFQASNFQSAIPKYLSLVADPGKGIRRKRRSKSAKSTKATSKAGNSAQAGNGQSEADSTTDSADESADELPGRLEGRKRSGEGGGGAGGGGIPGVDDADERPLSKYAATRVAAELASHQTLNVAGGELTSRRVKDFSIPTVRVRETVCRQQIRQAVDTLRECKLLQPYAIQEPLLFQYLSESLVVIAALTNLQR